MIKLSIHELNRRDETRYTAELYDFGQDQNGNTTSHFDIHGVAYDSAGHPYAIRIFRTKRRVQTGYGTRTEGAMLKLRKMNRAHKLIHHQVEDDGSITAVFG